jgi:hypothetical protein
MNVVRCADCGYLGLRNLETGALDEADEAFLRDATIRPVSGVRSMAAYDALPVCAKGAVNFREEANPGHQPSIVQAITKPRECREFMKRHTGLAPKEHRQMEIDHFIRTEQARLAREQREWQEARQKEDREHREKREDDHRRFDKIWGLFASLVIALVSAIVGYIFGSRK